MIELDPFALATRQLEIDRESTRRVPALFDRKRLRLAQSPHAFLRGSAPLYYEMLASRPELASGPGENGWIVGDMHLENVGAYRDDADRVVFGLNDFDDATVGPLRLDVLRLSTSILVASHASGTHAIALVERAVEAYLKARSQVAPPSLATEAPPPVAALVTRVAQRHRKALLDARAPLDHGKRRFVRGDRYLDLPPDVGARVPALMSAYVAALADRAPPKAATWTIEDAALRVAGNGSLGVVRIALLVRDADGEERLVEMKESRTSSVEALLGPPAVPFAHGAERVAGGARAMCAAPPRALAPILVDGLSLVGRRLFPQEDKLDLDSMQEGAELDELVAFIAGLVGAAHARGVAALGAPPLTPWTSDEIARVIDHAVVLAGLIESVYLAWSRRAGR